MLLARLAIVLFAAFASSAAHAGYQLGRITHVWVHAHTNAVDIQMSGTPMGRPACATEIYWRLDPSTPAGERLLAAVLTAHSSGKEVAISGTDTCPAGLAREIVDYIQLKP